MSSSSATPTPATLEGLASAVQARNPFTDNRVNGPSPDDVDVVDLHRAGFERLTGLAAEALAARRGLGAVVWGDAGIGKSHLLSRLARWARTDHHAYLVYLHNLQASPGNLPRAVVRSVMTTLNPRKGRSYLGSPLHALLRRVLRERMPAGKQSWGEMQKALANVLMSGPADAAMNDPVVP